MTFEEFTSKIELYKHQGKKVFTSSSFQTHSLVMLHMISRIDNTIPVYFINTGYHFPETLTFRDQVAEEFGLNVQDIKSTTPKMMQKDANGRLLFTSDPDHCCYLNKVQPMEPLLMEYDVWINGVRGDQSAVRKAMTVEQPAPNGAIRFHPMLDWTMRDIFAYIKEHNLPRHPLDAKGYSSIGCEPCTRKPDPEMHERESRWFGMKKVECGLHTDLVKK
ncbi:phosphoadenylyl-sulfate reductase [Mangrovivirga sp. M17]|uniref:Adenosine 5'-phosphosulfate reductase n=1 Tax=Mangrovivirga halotolerans TaxID=2993936 RepID=A0ABT3RRB6_9BACT|nr:phosphoadenylyl-sulfate reductase [Mangrovivirga halotolerans]MCX2744314.1 phosphoadenylyl-sulfate reductase [Mangrovivirga halotolerans]